MMFRTQLAIIITFMIISAIIGIITIWYIFSGAWDNGATVITAFQNVTVK